MNNVFNGIITGSLLAMGWFMVDAIRVMTGELSLINQTLELWLK